MTPPTARRMPAEWEQHDATWIAWPHEDSDWPNKFAVIPWVYAEITRTLALSERVEVLCANESVREQAANYIGLNGVPQERYRLHTVANDRSWLRDSAPTAVHRPGGEIEWISWRFNSWAKYDNHSADQHVPRAVAEISGIQSVEAIRPDNKERVVLEGGAIETDGAGTLLVTEECLLSDVQQRNPGLNKEGYEQVFREYLGISNTIWLGAGCEGDDTHGHIDDIARFVSPGRVVVTTTDDRQSANYEPFQENVRRLKAARDATGEPLSVIELPSPRRICFGDEVLPASYANFYIANSVVLVPTFNDPADSAAISILQSCFPNRVVIGISAVDLVLGQGTLHCLTQQQPSRVG